MKRGFMNSWMVPNYEGYKTIQKINQAMYILVEKLKATNCAPHIRKASLRCYKSWESYENQMLISLRQ